MKCLFYFTLRCLSETEELGSADLPDLATARDVALRIAPAFRVGVVQEGGDPADCAIEVSDQGHQVVSVVPL